MDNKNQCNVRSSFFYFIYSIDPALESCGAFMWITTQEPVWPWCKWLALSWGWRASNFNWTLFQLPAHAFITFKTSHPTKERDGEYGWESNNLILYHQILQRHCEWPRLCARNPSGSFCVLFILFTQVHTALVC